MNMYYNTKKDLCNYPVNSIQAWVSFISGSFSCSEKSFSGYFGFPSPQKPTPNSKFKFDLDSTRAHLNEFLRTLMCSVVKQIAKLQHSLLERQTPDAHFTKSPSFHQCSVYGYLKLLQSYMEKPRTITVCADFCFFCSQQDTNQCSDCVRLGLS